MPTMKDVARRAGVSVATVSRVMNETRYVDEKLKTRVTLAMEEMNYHPNVLARSLRQGVSHTIGLVVPDNSNPFFAEIARAAETIGFQYGYSVILCNSDKNVERETTYVHVLIAKQVDGIIFIATGSNIDNLPPVDDMVNYLIDLQSRQYNLPGSELFDSLLEDLAAWYQRYLGGQEGLLSALHEMILPPLLPGDGLIELICWLHQAGRLSISTKELSTQLDGRTIKERTQSSRFHQLSVVLYGTKEQAVYISRSTLITTLARDKLPTPDFARVTDDLSSRHLLLSDYNTPDGWVIKRSHWDERVAVWRKL